MIISGVYRITNTLNGKHYVGSSANVHDRWRVHRKSLASGTHHSKHLQRAWRKHGETVFEFVLIEEVEPEQLLSREQHYMDTYAAYEPSNGYNSARIAGSNRGVCWSEESRARVSASLKGRKQTEEHKAKRAAAQRGKTHSAETKERLREAALRRDPSTRKHSAETLERMSKVQKARAERILAQGGSLFNGVKPTPEAHRERMASLRGDPRFKSFAGRTHTDETRAKMRERALAREAAKRLKRSEVQAPAPPESSQG